MRKQFTKTIEEIVATDEKSVLLLGDIGVFGFRNSLEKYPARAYNIGILEQATISMAAGLAKTGLIPIVHTIAPFIVERAFEQLKDDFGYQQLGGNFISVGASYDYTALGATHHCPGDVALMNTIPGMEILVPGNSNEVDKLLKATYNNGKPTYTRLSEYEHKENINVEFGKANVIKKGGNVTIVCFGNMLTNVIEATKDIDSTILYYSTVKPFDSETLKENCNDILIVVEPFYEGSVNYLITKALTDKAIFVYNLGIPNEFIREYGKKEDQDTKLRLDVKSLREDIIRICSV
jgi:transketolase